MKNNKILKILNKTLNVYTYIGIGLLVLAIVLFLAPSIPQFIYSLDKSSTTKEITVISDENISQLNDIVNTQNQLPKLDLTLPTSNYISIPKIAVYSPLSQGKNYEEILKNGAWMVNNFPSPEKQKKPVIIAAHRFGYIYWSDKERKKISFYNLPKLKVGDTVEVIWKQRKYVYEIKKSEESRKITSYDYDLILYTCKWYSSPVRIFKYANLVPSL
jgi:LPXTG-site transpeptidase (sortase) family protein